MFGFEMKNEVAVGCSFAVLYLTYYLLDAVKRPRVVCGDAELRARVAALPALAARYWPPAWCVQAHVHTVLASLLRTRALPAARWRRAPVPLPDGGEGSLWWADEAADAGGAGTLLVVPGLCGDQGADYVRLLLAAARDLRLATAVYTHRGLAGQPLKTARLYSAVSEQDVQCAVDAAAAATAEGAPLLAAGVSLGGLLLARLLSAAGDDCPLRAALIISAPLDVEKGSACIESGGLNSALSWHMARALARTVGAHAELAPLPVAASGARSLRQFDAGFTAPHFGFATVDEYYAAASMRGRLQAVRVPTLCLNAADDPFQPEHVLPLAEAGGCARVALVLTARGGHIGFLEGARPLRSHFLQRVARQFYADMLRAPHLASRAARHRDHRACRTAAGDAKQ